ATSAPHLGRVGALLRVGRGVLRLGGGRRLLRGGRGLRLTRRWLFRGGRGLRLTRRRSAWTVFLQGRSLIGDEGLLARPRLAVQIHHTHLERVVLVAGGDHVRVERLLPGWDALLEQDGLRRHTQAVLERAIAPSVGGARGSPPLHHVGRGVRSRREGQGRAKDQRGDSGPNGCALSHEVQPLGVFLRANRNSAANSTSRATSTPRSTTAWACSACAASTTPSAASTPMTAAPSAYSAARTPGRASTSRNFSIYLFSFACCALTASTRNWTPAFNSAISCSWARAFCCSSRMLSCRPEAIAQCCRGVFPVEPIAEVTAFLMSFTCL